MLNFLAPLLFGLGFLQDELGVGPVSSVGLLLFAGAEHFLDAAEHGEDLLDQVDLRTEDLLLLSSVDDCHAQFKTDGRKIVARLASRKQLHVLLQGGDLGEGVGDIIADLQVVAEDVLFVEQVDRPGEEDAPLRRPLPLFFRLRLEVEALLAEGAEAAQ